MIKNQFRAIKRILFPLECDDNEANKKKSRGNTPSHPSSKSKQLKRSRHSYPSYNRRHHSHPPQSTVDSLASCSVLTTINSSSTTTKNEKNANTPSNNHSKIDGLEGGVLGVLNDSTSNIRNDRVSAANDKVKNSRGTSSIKNSTSRSRRQRKSTLETEKENDVVSRIGSISHGVNKDNQKQTNYFKKKKKGSSSKEKKRAAKKQHVTKFKSNHPCKQIVAASRLTNSITFVDSLMSIGSLSQDIQSHANTTSSKKKRQSQRPRQESACTASTIASTVKKNRQRRRSPNSRNGGSLMNNLLALEQTPTTSTTTTPSATITASLSSSSSSSLSRSSSSSSNKKVKKVKKRKKIMFRGRVPTVNSPTVGTTKDAPIDVSVTKDDVTRDDAASDNTTTSTPPGPSSLGSSVENTDIADTCDSSNTVLALSTGSTKKKQKKRFRGRRVTLDSSNIGSDSASMAPINPSSAIAAITPIGPSVVNSITPTDGSCVRNVNDASELDAVPENMATSSDSSPSVTCTATSIPDENCARRIDPSIQVQSPLPSTESHPTTLIPANNMNEGCIIPPESETSNTKSLAESNGSSICNEENGDMLNRRSPAQHQSDEVNNSCIDISSSPTTTESSRTVASTSESVQVHSDKTTSESTFDSKIEVFESQWSAMTPTTKEKIREIVGIEKDSSDDTQPSSILPSSNCECDNAGDNSHPSFESCNTTDVKAVSTSISCPPPVVLSVEDGDVTEINMVHSTTSTPKVIESAVDLDPEKEIMMPIDSYQDDKLKSTPKVIQANTSTDILTKLPCEALNNDAMTETSCTDLKSSQSRNEDIQADDNKYSPHVKDFSLGSATDNPIEDAEDNLSRNISNQNDTTPHIRLTSPIPDKNNSLSGAYAVSSKRYDSPIGKGMKTVSKVLFDMQADNVTTHDAHHGLKEHQKDEHEEDQEDSEESQKGQQILRRSSRRSKPVDRLVISKRRLKKKKRVKAALSPTVGEEGCDADKDSESSLDRKRAPQKQAKDSSKAKSQASRRILAENKSSTEGSNLTEPKESVESQSTSTTCQPRRSSRNSKPVDRFEFTHEHFKKSKSRKEESDTANTRNRNSDEDEKVTDNQECNLEPTTKHESTTDSKDDDLEYSSSSEESPLTKISILPLEPFDLHQVIKPIQPKLKGHILRGKRRMQMKAKSPNQTGTMKRARTDAKVIHTNSHQKATIDNSNEWNENLLHSLKRAYYESNPTSPFFWQDIAKKIPTKTSEQCRDKWFSLVITPKLTKKKYEKRMQLAMKHPSNGIFSTEGDDIFESTPLKHRLASEKFKNKNALFKLNVDMDEFPSPIRIKATDDKSDEDVEDRLPLHFKPKTYIQKMRCVSNRKMKKKIAKESKDKTKNALKQGKSVSASVDSGDMNMKGILSPSGKLTISNPGQNEMEEEIDEDALSSEEMDDENDRELALYY